MATYLQGVTDYIPQYQPFQPDFNFFAGVIQKKQDQYDKNWSKLNTVYGKFLNAPLTRQDNIKNRDQYFKQSVAAIQKITSMDLSLDQNVQQALQVFSPLYNDKSLLHDMGYTKKSMENFSSLESLKSCVGENCPGKYWEPGAQFIQYKMEEYKNASADQAILMSAPDAVPMIDVMKRAYDLAKEFKPITQETPQGMYIVTKKNGQLVQVPLYEHYKALIGEDPAVKKMYAVDAYVERENFVRNAEAQGVSREEANSIYAREKYEGYQLMIDDAKKNAETQGTSLQNQLDEINKFLADIPNLTENHPLVQTKQNLEQQMQVNEVNRRSVTQIADDINSGYKTVTPSGISSGQTGPQYTPQGADAIVAYYKMNSDFLDAAITNSALGAEIKVKADPVALARMREAGANSRARRREEFEIEQKNKEKTEEILFKNFLQISTEEIKTEFPEEETETPKQPYTEKIEEVRTRVAQDKISVAKELMRYLEEVSQSNDSSAATAKTMIERIGRDNPLTMSREEYTKSLLNKVLQKKGGVPYRRTASLEDMLAIIDPLKEGNEGFLQTPFGQTLNLYANQLRKTNDMIKSTGVEIEKTNSFNKRVLDKLLFSYSKESGGVKNEKYLMLKEAVLYPNGSLRSSDDIAKYLVNKYGKPSPSNPNQKVGYSYYKQLADQAVKAFNIEASEIIGDPQLGLKINPTNAVTVNLGLYATGLDGKLSINKYRIQGENAQTPVNMSFYRAYQTDIQPTLVNVDQQLKGAPKISIGYNPKNLASNNEVEVIKAITRELYDEAVNTDSKKAFEVSPLIQISGSLDKRGFLFKNVPMEVVNSAVSQFTINEDDAKKLKEKIVNQGFVIYGDSENFKSEMFESYNVDPRYNVFVSKKDVAGRPTYQETNRRGDAELDIAFNPVMQAYQGTVNYRYFNPRTNTYSKTKVSIPINQDVITNGAKFSQILREFDSIMENVTASNINYIFNSQLVDSE
jgi:hypothetical protein